MKPTRCHEGRAQDPPRARELEAERVRLTYARYDVDPSEQRKRDIRNRGNVAINCERLAAFWPILAAYFGSKLPACRVLDVGCGWGTLLGWLLALGISSTKLYGVDLLDDRIEVARAEHPSISFRVANADQLEFEDASFDLVTCWTLFSSIREETVEAGVASQIHRVLAKGGAIGWYDIRYPNPFNPNTKAMTRRRIGELFPNYEMRLSSMTVLPPLARRLGPVTSASYPALARLEFLRSHYLGLLIKHA